MAVCVITAIVDTDTHRIVPACVVHTAHAPCMHNGEPASTVPLEGTDGDVGGASASLEMWAMRTRQQRPFLMHHGSWRDEPLHSGSDCWCEPTLYEPNQTGSSL